MKSYTYSDDAYIAANENIKEKEYWLKQLSGDFVKSNFPFDFRRTRGEEAEKETLSFSCSGEVFTGLTALCSGMDIKLHMVLTAGLKALLYKYTNSKDLSIGSPVLKQEIDGRLINTILVYRTRLHGATTFKELLLSVRDTIIRAAENQNFPMTVLPEFLDLPDSEAEFPLFDIVLLLENLHEKAYLEGIPYHILFSFLRTGEALELTVEYAGWLYAKPTIERIISHFMSLLTQVLGDMGRQLADIGLLSLAEKQQLLMDFNRNRVEYPGEAIISELFESQAAVSPDCPAVVVEDPETGVSNQLSYRELNEAANQLARVLRERGVKPDTIVAVMAVRSLEMVMMVLAVIKSGGAYLPIDATYPAQRIAYILADSNSRILLIHSQLEVPECFPGEVIAAVPEIYSSRDTGNLAPANRSTDLVYTIYTSGSTGNPKGVLVQHNNFVNAAFGWRKEYNLETMPVNLMQMASFSFDVFGGDLVRALLHGGKLVITPEYGLEPEFLYHLITRYEITLFESTPSFIVPFMQYVYDNHYEIDSLKLLIIGSDTCRVEDFKKLKSNFAKQIRIINSYGVTEATIDSSYFEGNPDDNTVSGHVSIGKPLPNIKFYILDMDSWLVPVGVPGELYIGGEGITRGYMNSPWLTFGKFINYKLQITNNQTFLRKMAGPGGGTTRFFKKSPPGNRRQKLYKTGDLARWLFDGNVEFLGRMDFQVKIRGFRIEIGEIENRLCSHEKISEAVVVERRDGVGENYLCAYYVVKGDLRGEDIPASYWREYLAARLPDYMIPAYFVRLDRIPVTANGKIDKRVLPEPGQGGDRAYVAPRDRIEEKLVELWSDVLFGDTVPSHPIGIDDNFFELGGQSLKATVLVYRAHKELEVKLSLVQIFTSSTIRELAEYIKSMRKETFQDIRPVEKRDFYKLTSAQKRLYILQQGKAENNLYNIPFWGKIDGELDIEHLAGVFRKLIDRHESLRTSFLLVGNEPVQRIEERVELKIEYYENRETANKHKKNEEIIKRFIRLFDLSCAPLLRVGLIDIGNAVVGGKAEYILMVDLHHIIADGLSGDILMKEFKVLYEEGDLPLLRLYYKDFAQWQQQHMWLEEVKKQEAFWLKEFEEPVQQLKLPYDFPRPVEQVLEGSRYEFDLGAEQSRQLREMARAENVTMFTLLLTFYYVLLYKLSGQEDIVIGTIVAGRRHADLESVIGMFVNTVALRNFPSDRVKFSDLLKSIHQRTMEAFENQDYPFEDLVEKVLPHREANRNPLFDVLFTYMGNEVTPVPRSQPGGKKIKVRSYDLESSKNSVKFDMVFAGQDSGGPLRFIIAYSRGLFKEETIQRFGGYFKELVSEVLTGKDIKLADINISFQMELSSAEAYESIGSDFGF